ncbi:hypothetical protein [uncultured Desulfosarcina sp.]|uniref:hypothetical protein n=1 Tax=uncultured Desulfosarcina sp. TaxID=218289 RepID=UPI0029C96B70|nr:hypothetical protein [uncultured Desulfosarcina sp.]
MDSASVEVTKERAKIMKKRFRFRSQLVDKNFQLSFTANILLIAGFSMLATTVVVSWTFVYILNDHLATSVWNQSYVVKFCVIMGCIAVGIFFWTVWRSRSIAGPVIKIRKVLRVAAEGCFPEQPVVFRRGDAFPGLAEDLNRCLETMRADRLRLEQLCAATAEKEPYPHS